MVRGEGSGKALTRTELERLRREVRAGRVSRLYLFRLDRLSRSGIRDTFEVTKPQGSFYIMPRVAATDATAFVEKAIANNVLLIPGSVFSARTTHVRLSFATSEDQIERGVAVLRELAR